MKKATATLKTVKAAANNGKNIKAEKKLSVSEAMRGEKSPAKKKVAREGADKIGRRTASMIEERANAKKAVAKKGVKVEELKAVKVKKVTAANKPKAPATSDFNIKAFKKAIAQAFKKVEKDISLAIEVVATYKANRKQLKDALPKHAVNAFEKSLAAKKDESLAAKAIAAAQKHIVEKDFTM